MEFTVKQLKEKIKELGVKVPSSYRKDQLILLYEGALKIKGGGVGDTTPQKAVHLKYTPVIAYTDLNYVEHLSTFGWAITEVPNFNYVEIRDGLLSWINSVCPKFEINNKETWISKNIPYNLHGIFKNWVGHLEPIWKTREACIPIFEKIWKTDELLSSFDGFCLLSNTQGSKYYKQWMHCDQGKIWPQFACVQGVVNLYDNGSNDGGTLLMSGSHLKFKEYFDAHPIDGINSFNPIDPLDPILKDCPIYKPCLKAGEILLFDSRTFHCNIAPTSSNTRMCVYVSMQPRKYASESDLNKRVKLYETGRMTGHWCYGEFFNLSPVEPNPLYTKDLPKPTSIEIAPLNPVRKKLIGYPN